MKFARVDDTTWTYDVPDDPDDDTLRWKMRYAVDHLTRGEALAVASMLDAYHALVAGPNAREKLARARRGFQNLTPGGPVVPDPPAEIGG